MERGLAGAKGEATEQHNRAELWKFVAIGSMLALLPGLIAMAKLLF
jgi:hypothetical protein